MREIEQIRKKCIEANPEIVEAHTDTCDSYDDEKEKDLHKGCIKRPIRLADVLLAIDNQNKNFGKTPFLDTMGRFWKIENIRIDEERASNEMSIIGKWNLKENLEHQSKETIEFIHELIK